MPDSADDRLLRLLGNRTLSRKEFMALHELFSAEVIDLAKLQQIRRNTTHPITLQILDAAIAGQRQEVHDARIDLQRTRVRKRPPNQPPRSRQPRRPR